MSINRCGRALAIGASTLIASGCTTLPNGKGWGEDATFTPGWERVRTAATGAAKDPWVWAPLIGAAAFQIDNWDRRTSDWAREHTPVFGSQSNAERWSDDLRDASAVAHYATVLATPSGPDGGDWVVNKAKGTLVGIAAVSATVVTTNALKSVTDRERPNGDDSASFPSGHTSSSAVHTRLASRNLRSIDMSDGWRRTADVGLTVLTLGTSWARIEAGWHYPSDTLVGMALGNFIASFINDAFLGLEEGSDSVLGLAAAPDGVVLQAQWRF
ncbi:MAG TPA: phosphatase PAP2 family protein [Povalibacter sp.]